VLRTPELDAGLQVGSHQSGGAESPPSTFWPHRTGKLHGRRCSPLGEHPISVPQAHTVWGTTCLLKNVSPSCKTQNAYRDLPSQGGLAVSHNCAESILG